ncbi:hypothetical protein MPU67_000070 [Salmonella enterica subsp. enterica serovar Thompson]|nr:hypothetical protein [Salmonella enterica subsp. enterica serovar Thompson]EAP7029802.1 hypothetical protein [Salmonella enterica]EBJ4935660.1 hypothetical protein [Salmonella enterica]EEG9864968.1 hypothetical protein [Salmonella enterica]EEM3763742.1 hypothetical protein [Salmonella enterica]
MESKKLISIDVYRIDRAARFLGCEVDDILQWALSDKIQLCIYLPFKTVFSLHFSCDVSEIMEKIGLYEDKNKVLIAPHDYVKVGASEFRYVADDDGNWFFETPNHFWVNVLISGLWRINSKIAITNLINGDTHNIKSSDVIIAEHDLPCTITLASEFKIDGGDFHHIDVGEISISNVFITNNQLLKLYDSKDKTVKNKSVSERHSIRREFILASAVRALFDHREECGKNATDLFNYLNDHALFYNISTKNGSLTDHTGKLLSKVVNQKPEDWKFSNND